MKKLAMYVSMLVALGFLGGMIGCEWESPTDEDAQLSKNTGTTTSAVVTTNADGTVTTNYVQTTTTTTVAGGGGVTTTTTGGSTTTTTSGNQTTVPNLVLFSTSQTTPGRSLYSGDFTPIGAGIKPGSVTIRAGGYVFTDNGNETLTGTAGTEGYIEYETGAWNIDLKGADIPGQAITGSYIYFN